MSCKPSIIFGAYLIEASISVCFVIKLFLRDNHWILSKGLVISDRWPPQPFWAIFFFWWFKQWFLFGGPTKLLFFIFQEIVFCYHQTYRWYQGAKSFLNWLPLHLWICGMRNWTRNYICGGQFCQPLECPTDSSLVRAAKLQWGRPHWKFLPLKINSFRALVVSCNLFFYFLFSIFLYFC